jgi:hypothetical protein
MKGMNFRSDRDMLSVFLVLPSHEGEYKDEWNPATGIYTYEGHDSTTVEAGGKSKDQLLMYGAGKLSDNGKFYKVAIEFADGIRKDPLQVQVYEKIDLGVWFDKGFFNLVDARAVTREGRTVYKFDLQPSDHDRADRDRALDYERMLSVSDKIEAWQRDYGRCALCGSEIGLRFVRNMDQDNSQTRLLCAPHRGEGGGLLG